MANCEVIELDADVLLGARLLDAAPLDAGPGD
jgi:hypothetical protein